MNKKLLFIIAGSLIVLVLGIFMIRQYNLEKYYTEQKERIEIFFDYNYRDITSITFTDVGKNPMGTLVFEGYFNDDEAERFTASIMSHEENFEYHNVGVGDLHNQTIQSRKILHRTKRPY